MKQLKTAVLCLIAAVFCWCTLSSVAFAAETPTFVVEEKTAQAGDDVEITIYVKNNPGIASIKLKTVYDEETLSLNQVVYNDSIGGMSQQPQTFASPVTLNWFNGSANSEGDWVFATLTFAVSENAVNGNYPITISYEPDNVYDITETNLNFMVDDGGIIVSEQTLPPDNPSPDEPEPNQPPQEVTAAAEKLEAVGVVNEQNHAEKIAVVLEARAAFDRLTEEHKAWFLAQDNTYTYDESYLFLTAAEEYYEQLGLWCSSVEDQTYTGKKITPQIDVYHGTQLLKNNTDYKLTYKNNVNVNDASVVKKAPCITVTGKGNFSGTEIVYFKILPRDISEVTVAEVLVKEIKKMQKPLPKVTYNGITLKNKTHFTVTYPDAMLGAYQKAGSYQIVFAGKGNFTGTKTVMMTITENNLISKSTISKISNKTYTGEVIEPELTVKFGKKKLLKDTDYTVTYTNNVEVGTASATIEGIGAYSGKKTVTFKITGTSMKNVKVAGLKSSVIYTGQELLQDCNLTLKVKKEVIPLEEGVDYLVSYEKNINAGTAKVVFTGINKYTGVLKKSFKILPYSISADDNAMITVTEGLLSIYAKGGCKPKPVVMYGDEVLTEGVHYTLSYKNNTAVNDGSNAKKLPTISIKGKGNFKGTITVNFIIEPQDISNLTLNVADRVYSKKKNTWKSTFSIVDLDKKKLVSGKDYGKTTVTYTYYEDTLLANGTLKLAGEKITASDVPPQNTIVQVTAAGIGNYTGTITNTYRIVKANISSATVKVAKQTYTGKEVCPGKDELTVKIGKTTLTGEDYEIVSYSNNVKKGTASMVIKGVGNYGGTKTVSFKINAKSLSWWWR